MADIKWTKEQQHGINASGGGLVLSAGAGSGKTAVLVNRVIRLLTDEKNPCNPENLLVVTFTRAAASEMRRKIIKEISELITKNPFNRRLHYCKMALETADICTMDAFCSKILREHFYELDIDPDFKTMDQEEEKMLEQETAYETVEELHEERGEQFSNFADLFGNGRDDNELVESILSLYKYSMAYPFPDEWLNGIIEMYKKSDKDDSLWHRIIKANALDGLNYCAEIIDDSFALMSEEPLIQEKYGIAFSDDKNLVDRLIDSVKNSNWDTICNNFNNVTFTSFQRVTGMADNPIKIAVANKRAILKYTIKDSLRPSFCADSREHQEDLEYLLPLIEELIYAVKRFAEKLNQKKEETSTYSFSDIQHMAIRLLINNKGEKRERTEIAKELSRKYTEILIDEYQDTNEAQDILFKSISRDESNVFVVGDVKQSIYRFRLAMPEIFVSKIENSNHYCDESKKFPAKIILGKNFRSRKGIVDSVNYIFSQLMSKQVGDIDYGNDEKMIFGANAPQENKADAELHIVDLAEMNHNEDKTEIEAAYIANLIKDTINSNTMISTKDGKTRPVSYGDFCILLRTVTGQADIFNKVLNSKGIPCYSEKNTGFFDAAEVSVVLSLLKTIDNPVRDVELLALMFSPIYGFTPDEIALIRMPDKYSSLYSCVVNAAKTNEKAARFLEDLASFRRLSSVISISDFLRIVYEKTGYTAIIGVMNGYEKRKGNLSLLVEYAQRYEQTGKTGLSGFIRYLDSLQRNKSSLPAASSILETADVVRIMSIHKSKGLEFPFVIIGNCERQFNFHNETPSLILNAETGIGLKRQDTSTLRKFSTLPYEAAKIVSLNKEKSEILRVLYVAMTRAKDRLMLVMTSKDPIETINKASLLRSTKGSISPYIVRKQSSFADWLLFSLISHPDVQEELGSKLEKYGNITIPADFKFKLCISKPNIYESEECKEETLYAPSQEIIDTIEKKACYKYPYESLSKVVAKLSASDMHARSLNIEFFATNRPAFMSQDKLTAGQRGISTHKYLQYCNFEKAAMNSKRELTSLVEQGHLSDVEAKAVRLDKIDAFFQSKTAQNIINSDNVLRERKFTISVPVTELDNSMQREFSEEKIIIQGMVDCVYVEGKKAVVVDYKTDRIKSLAQLKERYSEQLSIYKRAVKEILDVETVEAVIYSLELSQEVYI